MSVVGGVEVHGREVDERTGCAHYRSERDVIAVLFFCCRRWYACVHCHDEESEHGRTVWPTAEAQTQAVLCGACGKRMTIASYRKAAVCPACAAELNPRCVLHHPLYFA